MNAQSPVKLTGADQTFQIFICSCHLGDVEWIGTDNWIARYAMWVGGAPGLAILRGSPNVPPLHKPYIILVDMNMPRMNGLEFLQALRQDPDLTDSVVFMLTTSDGFGDRLAAYKAHIAGYILKQNVDPDFVNVIQLLTDYQTLIALPA